jgi:hypothetical protein
MVASAAIVFWWVGRSPRGAAERRRQTSSTRTLNVPPAAKAWRRVDRSGVLTPGASSIPARPSKASVGTAQRRVRLPALSRKGPTAT